MVLGSFLMVKEGPSNLHPNHHSRKNPPFFLFLKRTNSPILGPLPAQAGRQPSTQSTRHTTTHISSPPSHHTTARPNQNLNSRFIVKVAPICSSFWRCFAALCVCVGIGWINCPLFVLPTCGIQVNYNPCLNLSL